jgi:hypothetical protein
MLVLVMRMERFAFGRMAALSASNDDAGSDGLWLDLDECVVRRGVCQSRHSEYSAVLNSPSVKYLSLPSYWKDKNNIVDGKHFDVLQ